MVGQYASRMERLCPKRSRPQVEEGDQLDNLIPRHTKSRDCTRGNRENHVGASESIQVSRRHDQHPTLQVSSFEVCWALTGLKKGDLLEGTRLFTTNDLSDTFDKRPLR